LSRIHGTESASLSLRPQKISRICVHGQTRPHSAVFVHVQQPPYISDTRHVAANIDLCLQFMLCLSC